MNLEDSEEVRSYVANINSLTSHIARYIVNFNSSDEEAL